MAKDVRGLTLEVLPESYLILRLPPSAALGEWILRSGFISISRSEHELSIVCPASPSIPEEITGERGCRCFRIRGRLDFSMVGVLASVSAVLAEAQISLFAISTFDTDYFLVKGESLPTALESLRNAGCRIAPQPE